MSETIWVGQFRPDIAREAFTRALAEDPPRERRPVRDIAIKINLCDYRRADSGATTCPEQVGALLAALRVKYPGARMRIVENDATTVDMWAAYKLLGFEDVARENGAELHNVADGEWVMKPVPNGTILNEFEVPLVLEETDLFINFAKLKTNALTKTTGCLKNIFAFLKTKRKVIHHGHIDEVLVDMNKVIKNDWCIVDGHIGMQGLGPAFGKPKRCDLLVAGVNPVAVDSAAARIMGFSPRSVRHIRMCSKEGMGPMSYELKTDIPDFGYKQFKFEFPTWEYHLRSLIRRRAGMAT